MLSDTRGRVVSTNLYWESKDEASQRRLDALAPQPVSISARATANANERVVVVTLVNRGKQAALNAKLTLVDALGNRILPVYYSDNYLSLLPGQRQDVEVHYPAAFAGPVSLRLRGWNVKPVSVTTAAP